MLFQIAIFTKIELITFPGSAISKEDTGVEYYKVADGVYEDRCNIPEAKKCVELIIEHIKNHPDLSLGIIAFSEKQQSTIEQVLYEYREQHPEYEWFFDENKDEPFFIKILKMFRVTKETPSSSASVMLRIVAERCL